LLFTTLATRPLLAPSWLVWAIANSSGKGEQ
jgi:hypothetical protein